MSARRISYYLATLILSGFAASAADESHPQRRAIEGQDRAIVAAISRPPIARLTEAEAALPPLPEGVSELKFGDFFKRPVGPRGLEPSDALKQLDGKKVRLVGYFVFEDWTTCSCPAGSAPDAAPRNGRPAPPAWMKHVIPGRAMFSPVPVAVSLGHYGLSDDLPPQVAFINVKPKFGEPVFYKPGLHAVIGTVSLGNHDEPDGRVSYVRITVENEEDIFAAGRVSAAAAPQQALTLSPATNQPTAIKP